MTHLQKKTYTLLTLTIVLWGVHPPIIKYTLRFISPQEYLYYRFFFASLILGSLWIAARLASKTKEYLSLRRLGLLALLGLLSTTINLTLLFHGIKLSSPSSYIIFNLSVPMLVISLLPLGSAKKRLTPRCLGLAIVTTGVTLVLLEPYLVSRVVSQIVGNLLIVGSGITLGTWFVLSKYCYRKNLEMNSPLTITTIGFIVSLLVYLPLMLLVNPNLVLHPLASIPPPARLGILYTVVFVSLIAFVTHETVSKLLSQKRLRLVFYLQPLITLPLAIFWLGELLSLPFLLGAGIITSGILLTEYRRKS